MIEAANENRRLMPSRMDLDAFLESFGGVYEHSSWIAEDVFAGGLTGDHDTIAGLHGAMRDVVEEAESDKKHALLQAHPDLAGKLAKAGDLTAESTAAGERPRSVYGGGIRRIPVPERALQEKIRVSYFCRRGRRRQEILDNFGAGWTTPRKANSQKR